MLLLRGLLKESLFIGNCYIDFNFKFYVLRQIGVSRRQIGIDRMSIKEIDITLFYEIKDMFTNVTYKNIKEVIREEKINEKRNKNR